MQRIQKTIDIGAPTQRIFEFITQPTNLPGVWPSLIDVSNVDRRADGFSSLDWIYKMAGIHFRGKSITDEVRGYDSLQQHNEGGIQAMFKWTLIRRDSGTALGCEVEYTMPTPVLGRLAEAVVAKLNERELGIFLENVKTTLEAPTMRDAEPIQPQATP
jgi:hypothetical protein